MTSTTDDRRRERLPDSELSVALLPSDLSELKRLAGGATKGPWAVSGVRAKWIDPGYPKHVNDAHAIFSQGVANEETIALVLYDPKQHHACWMDAKFIAAANPTVVLAILSKLEAAEKEVGHQSKCAQEWFDRHQDALARAQRLEDGLHLAATRFDRIADALGSEACKVAAAEIRQALADPAGGNET